VSSGIVTNEREVAELMTRSAKRDH
jgi:hypothetical protein